MLRISLLALGALSLSACASVGNLTAVNKKETLGSGLNGKGSAPTGVFIDAKQRAILSNSRIDDNNDTDLRVVCAEPAPDALSAIAAQAGLSVSDISNAVSAEGGASEAAANIGLRTQTIQTLRDGFYRVCEAYMNGLSEEQYSIMLRRFQTNMIALLAIEQLTGAVKGGDAVVSASAGSGMDYREQYLQRSAMASAEQTRLSNEMARLDEEISLREEVNDQCYNAPDSDGCSGSDIERRGQEISDLRTRRRNASDAQAAALATQRTSERLADAAPSASESSAGGVTGSWPSSPAYPPTAPVADAVRDITMAIVQNDYGVQLCFEHLRGIELDGETALTDRCRQVMDAYIKQLEDSNAVRVEMQRAKMSVMLRAAYGEISMEEANRLTAGLQTAMAGESMSVRSMTFPDDGGVVASAVMPLAAPLVQEEAPVVREQD